METVIVGVIVAVAAAVLVMQLRRKFSKGICECEVNEGGGKCSGCSGRCQPAATPKCRPGGAPSELGDTP